MTGPAWLSGTLAAVMILVSGYCLGRLAVSMRLRRPTDRGVDAAHVLMGVAMVGMLVPGLRVLDGAGWEIVFGAAIAWFAWRWLAAFGRRATAGGLHWHQLQHVAGCGAMLYMPAIAAASAAAGTAAPVGHAMSGSGGIPVAAFAFVLVLGGFVVWTIDRLTSLPRVLALAAPVLTGQPAHSAPAEARSALPLSPRLAACCDIVMGLTMAYMLIVMH